MLSLVAFTIFIASAEINECIQGFSRTEEKDLPKLIYYSGRDLNDLGNYHDCLELPKTKYFLLMFKVGTVGLSLGLCAPDACNEQDVEENIKLLIQKYESVNAVMNTDDVKVYESKKYNSRSMSGGAIASVLFIFLLLGIVIAGTFIDHSAKKNPEKRLRG